MKYELIMDWCRPVTRRKLWCVLWTREEGIKFGQQPLEKEPK